MSREENDAELLKWTIELLKKFQNDKIYGSAIVSFENGTIVRLKREENIKPPKI